MGRQLVQCFLLPWRLVQWRMQWAASVEAEYLLQWKETKELWEEKDNPAARPSTEATRMRELSFVTNGGETTP